MSIVPISEQTPSLGCTTLAPVHWLRAACAASAKTAWLASRRALHRLMVALAEYHLRRAVRELQQLDDRILSDIGLNRSTIDRAVRCNDALRRLPFAADWVLCGSAVPPPSSGARAPGRPGASARSLSA